MTIDYSSYNGNPTIILKSDVGTPVYISFGLTKAKLILENFEEIKKFVEINSGTSTNIKFHNKK